MGTVIAESEALRETVRRLDMVAPLDVSVLLIGEPGVGRQTLARYIYEHSRRSSEAFVVANIAALPEADLPANLFGRAATSQAVPRSGLVTTASGGTLLLQNIEDAPLGTQASILQLLQERVVRPLGGVDAVSVDCRVIATAAPDLSERVAQGRFRADLYYRLNVFPVEVPPLRDRREDILPLARHFTKTASTRGARDFTVSAMEVLLEYPWPGNVQQLKSVITRADLLAKGALIDDQDLALERLRPRPGADQIISHLRSKLAEAEQRFDTLAQLSIVATPIWQGRRFDTEDDLCFVLMPFSAKNDVQRVYQDHVKRAVESSGLRCVRADDIYGVSGIMQSVWESINRSRIVVAEMTGRNPNVFYELGIAHTLGKPVIMITQSLDDVPFDLKHLRCVVYQYKPHAIESFAEALVKTLATILREPPQRRTL